MGIIFISLRYSVSEALKNRDMIDSISDGESLPSIITPAHQQCDGPPNEVVDSGILCCLTSAGCLRPYPPNPNLAAISSLYLSLRSRICACCEGPSGAYALLSASPSRLLITLCPTAQPSSTTTPAKRMQRTMTAELETAIPGILGRGQVFG